MLLLSNAFVCFSACILFLSATLYFQELGYDTTQPVTIEVGLCGGKFGNEILCRRGLLNLPPPPPAC